MKLTPVLLTLAMIGSASAILPPPPPSEVDAAMEDSSAPSPLLSPPTDSGSYTSLSLIPPPPPSETETVFESHFQIGYVSNYDYKGMVVSSALCRQGDNTYAAGMDYSLSNGMILDAGLLYTDIFGGRLNADNQTDFSLGLKDELFPNLNLRYGYNLTHGGFVGEYAKYMGEAHSVTQSFDFSVDYKFGISGYFAGVDFLYSFQGLTGWWLSGKFGYEYEFTEKLNLRLTTGLSASWSYWQTEGANQIFIQAQLAYKMDDNWTVSPFVSTNWLCQSGLKMNSRAGEHIFRPFTLMAGAQIGYQF